MAAANARKPRGATAIIVPYKAGSDADLGPVVQSDYFGDVPADLSRLDGPAGYRELVGKIRGIVFVSQVFRERDFLKAGAEATMAFRKRHLGFRIIERLNVECSFAAANHKMTPRDSFDFVEAGANRCGGAGVLEHGEHVVEDTVLQS